MPESGPLGSVRGARGNLRPYRDTSDDASKGTWTASKPGSPCCSGISVEDTYLLTMRCPVFRRRDSRPGFRMELETLAGHAKGKGTSGGPARLKVPMGQSGADRPIVVTKRGNARGAKGAGHSRPLLGQRETGGTQLLRWKASAFVEWHEPDEARVLTSGSVRGSG